MKPNKVTLFLNETSKSGKGRKNWKFFKNHGFKEVHTKSGKDLLEKVKKNTNHVMVAVGGDGTINLTLNGIMQSKKKKALGVLYAGTSPDFCKFHKIPIEPEKSIQTLLKNTRKKVDVVKITSSRKTAWFSSSCNIGLGVEIAGTSNKIRKYVGDTLGTFIAVIFALIITPRFSAEIRTNKRTHFFKKVRHLTVLKNNFIASGLHLNIPAKTDNGNMYLILLEKISLKTVLGLYKGKIPKDATIIKTKSAQIKTIPPVKIEFDGDPQDIYTPITAACLKKRLEIIG